MKKTRWLSVLLVLVLLFSLCASAFAADPQQEETGKRLRSDLGDPAVTAQQPSAQYKAGDQVRVIVLTKSQPTAENGNFFQRVFNTDSKLMREHSAVKERMEKKDVAYQVNFEYTALLNGMSLTVDYADLDEIAALPGVTDVIIAREYGLPVTEPKADTAAEMIGFGGLNEITGADGSGKVIAVLDTGITADHEAFGVYDGMLQTPAWEKVDMIKAIADLGHGVYFSQKVPYTWDYADNDNDAKDDNSGHGSHVAGIAAGYAADEEGVVTFHGSAPDAQILAMKIFSSQASTTSSDIYYAALEDAYKLGADVINMSIGSPNGFVEDAESVLNDRIYERLENAGIICCISAGNEANLGEYSSNRLGAYVLADNADYGVLGAPASYNGNVAVAAVENYDYPAYLIMVGEDGFPYRDSNGTALLDKFADQDLEYVMVPDLGVAEAYENLDVRGKVAVISRGEITFGEKVAYAAAAGAEAAVIYDNRPGALVSMAIDNHVIPSVFVSQEAGAALAANETGVLHVNGELTTVLNPERWGMADFSSWGPTNDLQIKPTISGIGGNVFSVLAGTEDSYEVESGTSMSAPNVSGGYATLLDAICAANPDMSKKEAADLARNRTLSHAYVLIDYMDSDDEGNDFYVPYSPRRQGAGLMDLAAAYNAKVTIADPLAELGDDPAKSGVYTITAELENISDAERTYEVSADVLADYVDSAPWGTLYNLLQSALLEEGTDYTIDAPETVTLAPGEKKTVTATITLTDDVKAGYLDAAFANGAFIEGYLYFDCLDEETSEYESAHVTFLAFYGDWSAAPIIENHDWRELMGIVPEEGYTALDYVDWEIDTTPTMAYLTDSEYNPKPYAGDAPLGYPEDGMYDESRIAVSYNVDEAYFTTLLVVPTIIRNVRHVVMIARNAETGEIYAVDDTPYCNKTIFDTEEQAFTTYAWFLFDGTNIYSEDGTPIEDDTQVVLEFYANIPYGEDALGAMTPEEMVENGQQYLQYTVPVVVDGQAPVIEDAVYDAETGDVTVTVSDNQFLAGVYAVDEEGNALGEDVVFADAEPGESHTVTIHVGEQEVFYVAAMDYATNEGFVVVTAEDHVHDWTDWEVDTDPTCTEEGLMIHYCQVCGEEETKPIETVAHTLTKVEAVPATCEEDGVAEYWTCEVCGKLFADEAGENEIEEPAAIEATGHEWDEGVVTVEPTLVSKGEMTYTCKHDPSHTRTEVLDKLYDCDGGENCPSKDYTDVDRSPNSWSHEPIDWAILSGVTVGTSKTTFSPNKACTRAEAVTFLWRAAGCPAPADGDKPFTDVTLDKWYAQAVLWAVQNGITQGTSATTFSPDKTCTRAQIVSFLWRFEHQPEAKAANTFQDVSANAYYAQAVDWAVENGITSGVSANRFAPNNDCTRAQIVTFLFRDLNE